MKLTFKLSKSQVQKAYNQALHQATKTTTIKGFRKGKAPKKLVEEKVGTANLQRKAIEAVLPKAFADALKAKKISPISYPDINLKSVEKNGDWIFEAEVPQKPKITLGDYQTALKKAGKNLSQKPKIWLPGDSDKPKSNDQTSQSSEDKLLTLMFDTLLATAKLTVPQQLVDREVKRQLSRLIEQLEKLGVSLEDYLKSISKTKDELLQEYHQTATDSLKLEFILQEIAIDQNISVSDTEVDTLLSQLPDDQKQSPSQDLRLSLKLILLKRKVIDYLSSLLSQS